jgi:hypothetical protein
MSILRRVENLLIFIASPFLLLLFLLFAMFWVPMFLAGMSPIWLPFVWWGNGDITLWQACLILIVQFLCLSVLFFLEQRGHLDAVLDRGAVFWGFLFILVVAGFAYNWW